MPSSFVHVVIYYIVIHYICDMSTVDSALDMECKYIC